MIRSTRRRLTMLYPIMAADADTIITPDALVRLARPFLLGARVAAAGGTIRVANGCVVQHARVVDTHVPRRYMNFVADCYGLTTDMLFEVPMTPAGTVKGWVQHALRKRLIRHRQPTAV